MQFFNVSAAEVVTSAQLAQLSPTGCVGLTAYWVMNLPDAALSGWSGQCISVVTETFWWDLDGLFVRRLPSVVFASINITSFSAHLWSNVSVEQFNAIPSAALQLLSQEGSQRPTNAVVRAIFWYFLM